MQFKLRGERDLSDDILLVYLGAEDIKALGGWPITRDYYGYITHALTQFGAEGHWFQPFVRLSRPAFSGVRSNPR
ncbi:MAG: hypothetical protein E2O77_02780 [Caldithrix sp.]|nr:MAG: hypothetical protein E2O77_02780 [Caldithrix sp.]